MTTQQFADVAKELLLRESMERRKRKRRPHAYQSTKKRQKLRWGETTRFPLLRIPCACSTWLAGQPCATTIIQHCSRLLRAAARSLTSRAVIRCRPPPPRRPPPHPVSGNLASRTIYGVAELFYWQATPPCSRGHCWGSCKQRPDGEEQKDGPKICKFWYHACARRPQSHLPVVAQLVYFQIRCVGPALILDVTAYFQIRSDITHTHTHTLRNRRPR